MVGLSNSEGRAWGPAEAALGVGGPWGASVSSSRQGDVRRVLFE